ncbi:hypothetical protein Dimus_032140 [Dionaea muscipula]
MEQREGSTGTGGAEQAAGDRPPSRRWVVGRRVGDGWSAAQQATASVPSRQMRRCRAGDGVVAEQATASVPSRRRRRCRAGDDRMGSQRREPKGGGPKINRGQRPGKNDGRRAGKSGGENAEQAVVIEEASRVGDGDESRASW